MASSPLIGTKQMGIQVPGWLPDSTGLCSTCRSIPFHVIPYTFSPACGITPPHPSEPVKVADVGSFYSAAPLTPCPLCRMLHSLVDATDAQATTYELWAIHPYAGHHIFKRFSYIGARLNGYTMCIFLVKLDDELSNDRYDSRREEFLIRGIISGKGAVFRELRQPADALIGEDSAVTARPVDADRFDDRAVLDMVQYCKEHHGLYCNSKPQYLPGFTVLDCETNPVRRLRPETSIPYLALSYVWGSLASPASFSPVVMDAITVTKRLGYRYLWVDQYCIDQTDEIHKMSQISHMGVIYHNADITIIASASQNQQEGLPGVSCPRTRNPGPPVLMGSLKFTKAFPDPGIEVRKSNWATRGWTFQEAVLSRRRLFFLKDQVYYECGLMNQEESVKLNRDKLPIGITLRDNIYRFFRRDWPFGFHTSGCEELLNQYTSRVLTFPDDAFNAFKGVWSRLETMNPRLRHVCGLPHTLVGETDIQPYDFRHKGDVRRRTTETNFWRSLSWHHEHEAVRRSQFPSWSWLGWAGQIAFSCQDIVSSRPYSKAKVWFQRKHSKTAVWEPEMLALDEVLCCSQDTGEVFSVMHLKTECLPEEVQIFEEGSHPHCRVHDYVGEIRLSLREPFTETARKFRIGEYRAALLRSTNWAEDALLRGTNWAKDAPLRSTDWDKRAFCVTTCRRRYSHSLWFIVLREKQPSYYERIGTLHLQQVWLYEDISTLRRVHRAQAKILGYLTRSHFIIE